jgi:hypothetical protein
MNDFDDRELELKRLVTALATEAPMSREELLMLLSGTIFSSPRHAAMKLHNRAVARINGAVPNPARQREREEARLLPIEP